MYYLLPIMTRYRIASVLGAAVLAFALASTTGCKSNPLNDPEPTDVREFRDYLTARIPNVLDASECQCCKKSLTLCYKETMERQRPSCPDN